MSNSASRNLLSRLDVYGWQAVEDVVLAALLLGKNMLIIGEKGQGKTWLAKRLMQALGVARRNRGEEGFPFTELDGHAANPQDLVGYPFPPDDDRIREAIENDESPEMLIALSPNTIAGSKGVIIDEATRIPPNMQNRYLGLMEEGVVEGRPLEVQQIIGAANPVSYQGTEIMDEAYADRWRVVVRAPSFLDMTKGERVKGVKAQAVDLNDSMPDLSASKDLLEFLESASEAYEDTKRDNVDKVAEYVANTATMIDKALNGSMQSSDPDIEADIDPHRTTADIGTRRGGIVVDNALALHAVRLVRGESESLAESGWDAFQSSLVHRLHNDEPIPQELLEEAHDLHSGVLESDAARARSLVEATEDPVRRVAKAIRMRLPKSDVSNYVQEAYKLMTSEGEMIRRHVFSWVLLNRIQHDEGEHLSYAVTDSKLDLLVEDVKNVLKTSQDLEISDRSVQPDHEAADSIEDFLLEAHRLRQTREGRLTLAVAAYAVEHLDSSKSKDVMSGVTTAARQYREMLRSIEAVEDVVDEMVDIFLDLSKHENAIE